MQLKLLGFISRLQDLVRGDNGQGLVEYALLITLISLGLVTAMNGIATSIGTMFVKVSTDLSAAA